MLFFKQKQASDEILPPPPPFPAMELDEEAEEIKVKPKYFDKILKPEELKGETFSEESEFKDLVRDLDRVTKPSKATIKKERLTLSKALKVKGKLQKKQLKHPKSAKKGPSKQIESDFDLDKDLGLEDLKIDLPEEIERTPKEDIKLPDTLEDFDIDFEKLGQESKAKPKELLEAEEEIKSAIDNIKGQKTSFFKRFFAKKEAEKESEVQLLPDASGTNDISKIQESISKAREALMRFDLETARKNYVEVMKLYNKIGPEDKAKVYHDINDLYFERKSAEDLKV